MEQYWFYLIRCTTSYRTKLGITNNIDRRFRDIQAMSPTELRLIARIPLWCKEDAFTFETYWKQAFAGEFAHGEWLLGEMDIGSDEWDDSHVGRNVNQLTASRGNQIRRNDYLQSVGFEMLSMEGENGDPITPRGYYQYWDQFDL